MVVGATAGLFDGHCAIVPLMPLVPSIKRPLGPILPLLADDVRPPRLEDVGGTLEEQHAEDELLEFGTVHLATLRPDRFLPKTYCPTQLPSDKWGLK